MKTEKITSFHVYSQDNNIGLNILVDKIWLENDRVYFRVNEFLSGNKNYLRKEKGKAIFSIHESFIFSIRCRIYMQASQSI
ncbi:MAG: hypothetical protein ACFFFB_23355 [Candidatus Heimdallarchaeota archaeon]